MRCALACPTVASSGTVWQLAACLKGNAYMTEARYDVVGLGNAIVDVLSRATDAFLEEWGIHKNAMNLIEEDRAEALTQAAIDPFYTSGGSGANTIAGIASFGSGHCR